MFAMNSQLGWVLIIQAHFLTCQQCTEASLIFCHFSEAFPTSKIIQCNKRGSSYMKTAFLSCKCIHHSDLRSEFQIYTSCCSTLYFCYHDLLRVSHCSKIELFSWVNTSFSFTSIFGPNTNGMSHQLMQYFMQSNFTVK